jgi:hypothetical protein
MKFKRESQPKKQPGKPGRRYTPRPCVVCGAEATLAVSSLVRNTGRRERAVKMGPTILLCDKCTRSNSRDYESELAAAAQWAINFLRKPAAPGGPGLFAAELGRGGDHQQHQAGA